MEPEGKVWVDQVDEGWTAGQLVDDLQYLASCLAYGWEDEAKAQVEMVRRHFGLYPKEGDGEPAF